MASVLEAVIGTPDIPEVAITSPTAPGVTHRWINLRTFVTEVPKRASGLASTTGSRPGQGVCGRQIGEHVVKNFMQLVTVGRVERSIRSGLSSLTVLDLQRITEPVLAARSADPPASLHAALRPGHTQVNEVANDPRCRLILWRFG